MKIMDVIWEMGFRIPEDVAIVGFDDTLMSSHTRPPLTTVRQPSAKVGHRAANLLLDRIKGGAGASEPVHERIACELVIRKSSGEPI